MNMKKINILLLSLMVMMLPMAFADALTCSVINPASGNTITDNTEFNVSFAGGTNNASVSLNVTAYSTSTQNTSTDTRIITQTNLTGAALMANGSINASMPTGADMILEDSGDYTVVLKAVAGVAVTTCG